jgi:hypothetical protein
MVEAERQCDGNLADLTEARVSIQRLGDLG